MRLLLVATFLLLLGGCAGNIPLEIREDVPGGSPGINAVRSQVVQYEGSKVRWGGTIAEVENKAAETWLEVVGRELGSYGRPRPSDLSQGRFLARIEGFADPAIYRKGREVTVYGTVESRIVRTIDEYPYAYPLVRVQSHYLWRDHDYYRRHYAYHYPYGYYHYPFHYGFHYRHFFGHHPGYHFGFHHHFHHW